MLIGEDDNFDLYGCIDVPSNMFGSLTQPEKITDYDAFIIREIVENYARQSKKDKNDLKVVHFIWAGRTDASFFEWYQQALFEFFKAELCRNGILQ